MTLTPEDRANDVIHALHGKTISSANMGAVKTLVEGHIKAALKDQRRETGERIAASPLPNKDEVTAVVFPVQVKPPGKKWVDLSQSPEVR